MIEWRRLPRPVCSTETSRGCMGGGGAPPPRISGYASWLGCALAPNGEYSWVSKCFSMSPQIRSHRAPCSCFPKKVSLQLSPGQSVGDVGITQLDWKRVQQASYRGSKVLGKHEHGALWLLTETNTHLLTYIIAFDWMIRARRRVGLCGLTTN